MEHVKDRHIHAIQGQGKIENRENHRGTANIGDIAVKCLTFLPYYVIKRRISDG